MRVETTFSPLNHGFDEGIHFAQNQFTIFPNVTVSCMLHNNSWRDSIKISGEVSHDEIDEFQRRINKLQEICDKTM